VYDSTVVRRILAEGAVIMGKTNLDEFSMGSSCEYSAYKTTENPWCRNHSPGGSSGGSAAAVAGGLVPVALGSDTGGSIRQPASLCGCVGFKPTYGTVSRFGLVAFASSLDQVGPLTTTVRDAALVYEIMAGHDPKDSTTLPGPAPSVLEGLDAGIAGLRIGVPEEYGSGEVQPEVRECVKTCLEGLAACGAEIQRITLPHTRYAIPTYYLVANAEASSNLSRFDGMRYGTRSEGADLRAVYRASRKQGFGPEVKRRIMLGAFALREGYYDAFYLKALKVRRRIQEEFQKAFEEVDLIMGPTAPHVAFPLKEKIQDPLSLYRCDILTAPASLAGIPGLSIPCGLTKAGLPVGLQILGPPLADARVLRAAWTVETWRGGILRSPWAEKTLGA
jgi:aspartyl-tRNA(Asn)/glutamyl-tRNA(Gln) amidotransferase subunit A